MSFNGVRFEPEEERKNKALAQGMERKRSTRLRALAKRKMTADIVAELLGRHGDQ